MDLVAKPDPLFDWDDMPLSHARILYNNLLNASTSGPDKALTPNTYERWTSASGTMTATFQLSSATDIDCIAIAGHNLGSTGSEIVVAVAPTVAGTFTDVGAKTPTDNSAMMFMFDKQSVADVQITVTGGTDREIAVVFAGTCLQMYQPLYGGHTPIDLSAETEYQQNGSDTGQFLGRNIIRKGTRASYSWRHLDDSWVREKFKPFIESAKIKPFFIMWRPDYYPDSVAFGHSTNDIRPTNMGGGHRYMSVQISMRAHDDI